MSCWIEYAVLVFLTVQNTKRREAAIKQHRNDTNSPNFRCYAGLEFWRPVQRSQLLSQRCTNQTFVLSKPTVQQFTTLGPKKTELVFARTAESCTCTSHERQTIDQRNQKDFGKMTDVFQSQRKTARKAKLPSKCDSNRVWQKQFWNSQTKLHQRLEDFSPHLLSALAIFEMYTRQRKKSFARNILMSHKILIHTNLYRAARELSPFLVELTLLSPTCVYKSKMKLNYDHVCGKINCAN